METIREIAQKTGLNVNRVARIAEKNGLLEIIGGKKHANYNKFLKCLPDPKHLLNARQIADIIGCSTATVFGYMAKYPCCCFDFAGKKMGYVSHIRAIYSAVKLGRAQSPFKSQIIDTDRVRRALKEKRWKVGDFLREANMREHRYYAIMRGEEEPTHEEKAWFRALTKGVK